MPLLVDTSVWIEYFRRPDSQTAARLRQSFDRIEVVVGDLIAVEVLQGFRDGAHLRMVEASLRELRTVPLCGPIIAPKAAANYRAMRRSGFTVRSTIDVIIATWCIENKTALLHNDRDFTSIEAALGLMPWS